MACKGAKNKTASVEATQVAAAAVQAEVCPTYADCRDVTWYSNNSSIASVNATTGYIYANGVGFG